MHVVSVLGSFPGVPRVDSVLVWFEAVLVWFEAVLVWFEAVLVWFEAVS